MPTSILFLIKLTLLAALSAASLLILTRLSGWLSSWITKEENDDNKITARKYKDRYRDPNQSSLGAIAARIETIGDQIHAQNKKHERQEKKKYFLEIVGISAAIIAAIFAGWSAMIFQSQLKEARDERRAWVSSRIELAGRPIYSHFNETFTFNYNVKNTGNSPAMNVFLHHWSDTSPANNASAVSDWIKRTRNKCDVLKRSIHETDGQAIFPGDQPTQSTFTENVSASPKSGPLRPGAQNIYQYALFGCVTYRTVDEIGHATPFLFLVKNQVFLGYPFLPPRLLDIPWPLPNDVAENLHLVPASDGLPSPD